MKSCDLNQIENCWTGELIKTSPKAWKKLAKDTAYITSLTDSMPRHVVAVIEANGEVTKY